MAHKWQLLGLSIPTIDYHILINSKLNLVYSFTRDKRGGIHHRLLWSQCIPVYIPSDPKKLLFLFHHVLYIAHNLCAIYSTPLWAIFSFIPLLLSDITCAVNQAITDTILWLLASAKISNMYSWSSWWSEWARVTLVEGVMWCLQVVHIGKRNYIVLGKECLRCSSRAPLQHILTVCERPPLPQPYTGSDVMSNTLS